MDPYVVGGIAGSLYLLTCGFLGSYVSFERGRAWQEGFIFGVLLGPLGVIAAGCMPDRGEHAEAPDPPAMTRHLTDDVDNPVELERWLKRGGR